MVLAWLTNDAPAEDVDGIPNGVLYAVYPELKPVATARVKAPSKIDPAVLAALADVQIVLDKESAAKAKVYLADRTKALTVS